MAQSSSPPVLEVLMDVTEQDPDNTESISGNCNGNSNQIDDDEGICDDMSSVIERTVADAVDGVSGDEHSYHSIDTNNDDGPYDDMAPLIERRVVGADESSANDEDYEYEEDLYSNDASVVSVDYIDDVIFAAAVGIGDAVGDVDADYDDDNNDSQNEVEMPSEMYHFFRMIAQMETSHTNSDGEDYGEVYGNDHGVYGVYDGNGGDNNYYDRNDADNDSDEDYIDDDDSDWCACPTCLMDRISGCQDCFDDDSVDDDDELSLNRYASTCAICMEAETTKRRFVDLPCCGPAATARDSTSGAVPVDTSSTRFCQKCFAKHLVTNGCAVPCNTSNSNDISANKSKRSNTASVAQLAGECPRCKKLLVLEECATEEESSSQSTDDGRDATTVPVLQSSKRSQKSLSSLPYYRRARTAIPSTEALFWYVARCNAGNGETVDFEYRTFLLTLGMCPNPSYVPEELLLNGSGSPERIRQLCQWGMLRRRQTTREPLSKFPIAATLQRIFHSLLGHIDKRKSYFNRVWEGIASLFGAKLRTVWSYIDDRIRLEAALSALRSAVEAFHRLPNRTGIIYEIDPLFQSELRALVLRHLWCYLNSDTSNQGYECDHYYESDYDGNGTLRLLQPPRRPPTDDEREYFAAGYEKNGRGQCFLEAYNSFASAWLAARRFRLFRSLRLIDRGMSLGLLSTQYLGLPPITDWPEGVQARSTSGRPTPIPTPKGGMTKGWSSELEARMRSTRWRWHVLSVLNVFLLYLGIKIAVHLAGVAVHLVFAVSLCHLAGIVLETKKAPEERTASSMEQRRIVCGSIVLAYVSWHCASSYRV